RPYTGRLAEAEMTTGLADAMVIGRAAIDGRQCELAVMDFAFMGGSMGSVVGEKFSRACDTAAAAGMPVVSMTCPKCSLPPSPRLPPQAGPSSASRARPLHKYSREASHSCSCRKPCARP